MFSKLINSKPKQDELLEIYLMTIYTFDINTLGKTQKSYIYLFDKQLFMSI